MNRKYKINSAITLMKMQISFSKFEGNNCSDLIDVMVDFANNRVYFDKQNEDIDYADLEQEILSYLRPPVLEQPKRPNWKMPNSEKYNFQEDPNI